MRNEKARRFLLNMRKKPGVSFETHFPRADRGALSLLRRMLAFDPAGQGPSHPAIMILVRAALAAACSLLALRPPSAWALPRQCAPCSLSLRALANSCMLSLCEPLQPRVHRLHSAPVGWPASESAAPGAACAPVHVASRACVQWLHGLTAPEP